MRDRAAWIATYLIGAQIGLGFGMAVVVLLGGHILSAFAWAMVALTLTVLGALMWLKAELDRNLGKPDHH